MASTIQSILSDVLSAFFAVAEEEKTKEDAEDQVQRMKPHLMDIISHAPNWESVTDPEEFSLRHLSGAMTNIIFRIDNSVDPSKKLLLRLYGRGSDALFDRQVENDTVIALSKMNMAPKIYFTFEEGRIEEFLFAKTLSAADIRDPEISIMIARKLAQFHKLFADNTLKQVILWDRLRTWHAEMLDVCTHPKFSIYHLDRLAVEINFLERHVKGLESVIVFGHNDLQYGNIMLQDTDSKTNLEDMYFIDYDYCGYNHRGFDIANHFCEWAANYHSSAPHQLHFHRYPSTEHQERFVQAYLDEIGEPSEKENIAKIIDEVKVLSLASHLQWGIWGLLQAAQSNIDFDFLSYATQRLQQFYICKDSFLHEQRS